MTAGLRKIEHKLSGLAKDSTRYQVLAAVRQFRASWIELGRLLVEIERGGDWNDWGFDSFELYCARELGLKKPTVQKLLVSYAYMKKRAPERLQRSDDGTYDAPDYQTVALLEQAENKKLLANHEQKEFHRRAFAPWEEGGEPFDEAALRKEIRARFHDDHEPVAVPRQVAGLIVIRKTAHRLRELLAGTNAVPDDLKHRLEEALAEIDEIPE